MPETVTPPPVTEPNPPGSYNPANQPPAKGIGRIPNPALADALSKVAGIAPQNTPEAPLPQRMAQSPKAEETPAEPDETPEPPRFVAPDETEPAPVATTKTIDEPPAEVVKAAPAQLRQAYEKLKNEFASKLAEEGATKKELAEFRTKAKTYEDRIKSLEAAESRAKELEQQVLSIDERLRVTDYLNHPEFHEKYVKPVADALSSAHALVQEMIVDMDGNPRQATKDDFDVVLRSPNLTEATRRAKELFGPDLAQSVVNQRQAILQAERNRSSAVKDAALRSQEWLKTQQEQASRARTQARTEFQEVSSALAEKYPQLYKAPEGDKEAVDARRAGEELANLVVEGQPEGMGRDEYLSKAAKVYHRAAAFPVQALKLQRLEKELEDTKTKLARYEKSEPTAEGRKESGGTPTKASQRDQLRTALEAVAAKNR